VYQRRRRSCGSGDSSCSYRCRWIEGGRGGRLKTCDRLWRACGEACIAWARPRGINGRVGAEDVEHGDGEGEGPGLATRAFAAGAWTRAAAWERAASRGARPALREGAAARGRSIWAMSRVRAGARLLRSVRLRGGVLFVLCRGAAARGAPASQPRLRQDAAGHPLEPAAARPPAETGSTEPKARNGHDLDTRSRPADTAVAVELRGGAGARHGGVDR
jgi:hypothetical protein